MKVFPKENDEFVIDFSFVTKKPKVGKNGATYWVKDGEFDDTIKTTWDNLFAYLAPELLTPASEWQVTGRLNQYIHAVAGSN